MWAVAPPPDSRFAWEPGGYGEPLADGSDSEIVARPWVPIVEPIRQELAMSRSLTGRSPERSSGTSTGRTR